MILNTFLGENNTSRIITVASFCDTKIALNIVKLNDLRNKEFKKKLGFQRMPILDLDENRSLSGTSVILRYIASLKEGTSGASIYQQSKTDQWLELAENELETAALALVAPLQGTIKFDKDAQKAAQEDFMNVCKLLNHTLANSAYLTGASPTICDYSIFLTIAQVLRFALSASMMSKLPHLKKWLDTLIKDPHVVKGAGHIQFCSKPLFPPKIEEDE
jgi:glutathione S-transferase